MFRQRYCVNIMAWMQMHGAVSIKFSISILVNLNAKYMVNITRSAELEVRNRINTFLKMMLLMGIYARSRLYC